MSLTPAMVVLLRGTTLLGACVVATATVPHHARAVTTSSAPIARAAPRVGLYAHRAAKHSARSSGDTTTVTAAMIDAGRKVFHGQGGCATCHGQQLEGTPIAPTLKAHAWKDAKGGDLDAIYAVITHGVAGTAMVSHPGGITDAAATQVAAYVWAVTHRNVKP